MKVLAMLFSLLLPRGLWGAIEQRFGLSLLPVGYRLAMPPRGMTTPVADASPRHSTERIENA